MQIVPRFVSIKSFLFILICTFTQTCYSQDSASIQKWVNAVISLQCIPSFDSLNQELSETERQKKIPSQKRYQTVDSLKKSSPRFGTAIILMDNDMYYLISSRHTFYDETGLGPNKIIRDIILLEDKDHKNDFTNQQIDANGNFYTDYLSEERNINISSRTYEEAPYIFSDEDQDICIISLSRSDCNNCHNFIKTLLKRGCVPITISDLDTSDRCKIDDKVFAIGFPKESQKMNQTFDISQYKWVSYLQSNPFVSKGIISGNNRDSNFVEANIWVYHGFSGGPLIRKNKLIGIVKGPVYDYPVYKGAKNKQYIEARIAFKKSSLIPSLLRELQYKRQRRY